LPAVEFLPDQKTFEAPPGTPLVKVAQQAGVDIELPCGGDGSCGRCIVRASGGAVETESLGRIPSSALASGYVLACRTRICADTVTVELPDKVQANGQFADNEARALVDPALMPKADDIDPLVRKLYLKVAPPQLEDGLSDIDRLLAALRRDRNSDEVSCRLSAARSAATALREEDGRVTATVISAAGGLNVSNLEAGDTTSRHYGVAVDIGTTSVAVQLVYLPTGAVLATESDYNAQISCGVDVISRISYAAKPARLEELQTRVLETVNCLVCKAAFRRGVNPGEICHAAVAGNTVMTHLLLGLPPEQIRLEPYTPTVLQLPILSAGEVGLGICTDAPVELAPCVGSYVGGDITAGLLCTNIATETHAVNLFIDIGTNGEIVVGNTDFLMSCACSAGPAFEGGGIECGVRAAAGAIEGVTVDPETAAPTCSTIGDMRPSGICGSGMIDLLASLLRSGWIDRRGELDRSRPSPHIELKGKRARYTLVPAAESATGKPIAISETEIENVIRAKAAIYSAAALMLERVGLGFGDLDQIYIAGSFGRFLDLEPAMLIGMVPEVACEKYRYLGNASLTGSYMALVSRRHRRRQIEIAQRMTNIELSTDPEYMDQYTAALFLPHTDLGRFPGVAKELKQGETRTDRLKCMTSGARGPAGNPCAAR
jgi:uncharacterized 2Fe-2S/4Fe-4S cluster protein (DUF4445 family)